MTLSSSTQSPFNWKQPAGKALEVALNRALALDADTQAALQSLSGQRVALQLSLPPLALEIRVDGDALRVGPVDAAKAPDLGVRTTLGGLRVQIAKAIASALKHAQVVGQNFAETAAEYVTEEHRDVVPRAELEAFHDDVDGLRDDVERIAAKIARVQRERGTRA